MGASEDAKPSKNRALLTTQVRRDAGHPECHNAYTDVPKRTAGTTENTTAVDPDLALLISVWPTLAQPIRAGVLALVQAAANPGVQTSVFSLSQTEEEQNTGTKGTQAQLP